MLTRFILPIVTSSNPAFPVISVRAVESNSLTAPESSEFIAPSGLAYIIPSSLSTEKEIIFYLVYTALDGTEIISSLKKLIVRNTLTAPGSSNNKTVAYEIAKDTSEKVVENSIVETEETTASNIETKITN